MIAHQILTDKDLRRLIRTDEIQFGGNRNLKIYGHLQCHSGKRMKKRNRVFFKNEIAAKAAGFRPCGHCMKVAYKKWKNGVV